ncbi:MAG TPA: hypothetical protein VF553_22760 [Pyrinomonadaceae bacterium]|jgi:hypothetical protein
MMRRAFNCLALICFSLLTLSISAPSQSPATECPTITVDCPTSCYKPGQPFTVTANVTGADANKSLSYHWSVSSGTINTGQGTPSITITQPSDCQTMTATVEVKGLDSSCQNTASCSTTTDCCWVTPSRQFDKYGDLAFADEKKRLDHFAEQLKKEPESQGHIMVYGKRGAPAVEAQERGARAKDYLVTKGGIAAERLVTIDGGEHERMSIELWITPQGGRPPAPLDQYGEAPESN